jgi:putative sterol carrier protein
MTEKFEFLSPEWEIAAESLHDSNTADAPDGISFSMNVTITPTPFGDKVLSISAHDGVARVDKEHLEIADVTVKTDYETAYKLFLEGEMNIVLSAMLEGKIVVSGDVAKLLSMAANSQPMPSMPFLEDLGEKLKSITK